MATIDSGWADNMNVPSANERLIEWLNRCQCWMFLAWAVCLLPYRGNRCLSQTEPICSALLCCCEGRVQWSHTSPAQIRVLWHAPAVRWRLRESGIHAWMMHHIKTISPDSPMLLPRWNKIHVVLNPDRSTTKGPPSNFASLGVYQIISWVWESIK